MTDGTGVGGRDEIEWTRTMERKKKHYAKHTHAHCCTHLCNLTQWFRQWIILECRCIHNPSISNASLLFKQIRTMVVCVCVRGQLCMCVCAFVYLVQSPVLCPKQSINPESMGQYKSIGWPWLHLAPLSVYQCVCVCLCTYLSLNIIVVGCTVPGNISLLQYSVNHIL